jgi:ATP-dependent DNA helicase RecG
MRKQFKPGDEIFAHGKVSAGREPAMDHPETETVMEGDEPGVHLNRLTPIYPLSEGISQRWLRSAIWRLAGEWRELVPDEFPGLKELGFVGAGDAVFRLHVPENLEQTETARRRLAMGEFIALQIKMRERRRRLEQNAEAIDCRGTNELMRPFLRGLGFELTDAQTAVLREIRRDLGGRFPMRRLVQGDVGSGKTVIAACAALMALESGKNALLMAPTQILAEQHWMRFAGWFGPLGLQAQILTGGKKSWTKAGAETAPRLVIGTHALIAKSFEAPNLGLVIIDEQHKFGVAQREALVRKGRYPHLLVMTATPIPRSLGLTLYGDLDLSAVTHAPAGRGQIQTRARSEEDMPRILNFVRERLREGRQAYVVYPRIDDAGNNGARALAAEKERLEKVLAPFRVGLLHGRLPVAEKDAVMAEFRANRAQVLVATSVIEVGVDVPNAAVIIVMDAGQFGLAQTHQLRGRVGRGPGASYCILVARKKTPEALERLRILERTSDGFVIAEEDFRLRGPGELTGRAQSGLPDFRFGDLRVDRELVERAREWVGRG